MATKIQPETEDWMDGRRITDPIDTPVQLNVRIPWFYREQLTAIAKEERISFNRLIVNAIVAAFPPERPR